MIDNEFATALSDVLLAAGSYFFAINLARDHKSKSSWIALFGSLGSAALLGAIFHGVSAFHIQQIWTIVAGFTVASGFLFLSCSIGMFKPEWRILWWLWPVFGLGGLILGLAMSEFPFWVLSIPNGVCLIAGAWIVNKSKHPARPWILKGLGVVAVGLVLQIITPFEGLLYRNAVFHYCQLIGNYLLWKGAKISHDKIGLSS